MNTITSPIVNKEKDLMLLTHKEAQNIKVGKRIRAVDQKAVEKLAEDFRINGQLSPIICFGTWPDLTLVAGAHRLAGMNKVWETFIDSGQEVECNSYKLQVRIVHISIDNLKVIEISENLNRNDLSQAERKKLAIEYGELTSNMANGQNRGDGQNTNIGQNKKAGQKSWFAQWCEDANIPTKTAQNWWKEYKEANGLTCSPSKATKAQQEGFFAWHKEQVEMKEAEAAEKEAAATKTAEEQEQALMDKLDKEWLDKQVPTIAKMLKTYGDATNTNLSVMFRDIQDTFEAL